MRGEYGTGDSQHDTFVELPPRARRIPPNRKGEDNIMGTTSACAENTPFKIKTNIFVSNYLRVRGEYTRTRKILTRIMELPPRARRILSRVDDLAVAVGTTSACAENTQGEGSRLAIRRNYLRVRGEYLSRLRGRTPHWELPPRARRIHPGCRRTVFPIGTTSACAENT